MYLFLKKVSCVILALLLISFPTLVQGVAKSNDVIVFADNTIKSMTRYILDKPEGGITKEDVLNIIDINMSFIYSVNYLYSKDKTITTLEDLKWFKNLKTLKVNGCNIRDLTGIENLKNLDTIDISDNYVKNIEPIRKLTNLFYLDCSNNRIIDFSPLSNLTNLRTLRINQEEGGNLDVSVIKNLKKINYLDASNLKISDISALKNMKDIYILDLSNNNIKDISVLKGLTNLEYLYLDTNNISDISPLYDLPGLRYVTLDNNPIPEDVLKQFYLPKEKDYFIITYEEKISDNSLEFTFDLISYKDISTGDFIFTSLKITDSSSGKEIQRISIPELSLNGYVNYSSYTDDLFSLIDVNFDGYKDIRLFDTRNVDKYIRDEYIFLVWNPSKQLFEQDKNLNLIPNAVFNNEKQEIYGSVDNMSVAYYTSTFRYINGILTPVRYYSKEIIYYYSTDQIQKSLEKELIEVDLDESIAYHEILSELDLKTGEIKLISDEFVFYAGSYYFDPDAKEIARFDINSEVGKIIDQMKFIVPDIY